MAERRRAWTSRAIPRRGRTPNYDPEAFGR